MVQNYKSVFLGYPESEDLINILQSRGFSGGSVVKNLPDNAKDTGLIPEWGRSPGIGNDNPFQYSCLGNPWTEETGRLQSMGSQRVGPDWTKQQQLQPRRPQLRSYQHNLESGQNSNVWVSISSQLAEIRRFITSLWVNWMN